MLLEMTQSSANALPATIAIKSQIIFKIVVIQMKEAQSVKSVYFLLNN